MSFLLPFFSSRRCREAFPKAIHDKRDNEGSEWDRMTARQRTKIGRKAVRRKELIKKKTVISEKRDWTGKKVDSNEMHPRNRTNLVRHRASYSIVTCPVWVLPYVFPNFHARPLFIEKIRRVLEIRRKQETGFLLKGLERFTIGEREWQEWTKCENVRNCDKKEVKPGDRER